jgi:hypothetical protein
VFGCRNACGLVDKIDIVEVNDIISYHDPASDRRGDM